jgi:hypothetical protein
MAARSKDSISALPVFSTGISPKLTTLITPRVASSVLYQAVFGEGEVGESNLQFSEKLL